MSTNSTQAPATDSKTSAISKLASIKTQLKETIYRKKFDQLCDEIKANLVNTESRREKIDQAQNRSYMIAQQRPDGSTDWAVLPMVPQFGQDDGKVPRAAEPISFSKILVASSAISSRVPDGQTFSSNKIKARAYYDLLKRSWSVPNMNGYNTLDQTTQNVLTYGWGAWRQYPKQVIVDKTIDNQKVKKILYDDIFREPLDVRRTWFGLSYKAYVNDNRPEMLWEVDITKDAYKELKKRFGKRGGTDAGVSQEAQDEDPNKVSTHVTITFYENPLENKYIVASDSLVLYDGEIPNDECYGTTFIAHCFLKDMNDPHGVGLYEMMRGNEYLYNYVNSMNAEQVEAEIYPLLFIKNTTGQGDMKFKRSPNVLNPIPQGADIEKVSTSGNSTLGMNYANAQKQNIEDNTGVNNIVSGSTGSETTLGATVILKEAALARLTKPRSSLAQAIENDACVFFSNLEQTQSTPRKFIFASKDQIDAFMQANPNFQHQTEVDVDSNGVPVTQVFSSAKVPLSFNVNEDLLSEGNFENQDVQELGSNTFSISKASLMDKIKGLSLPDKLGDDEVIFKVDLNSMLIPSVEIQKQVSAQIYPIIQQSIAAIYAAAKTDPDQAIAQLKTLSKFVEDQKSNIYDYIPKDQYDKIMSASLAVPVPQTGLPGQPGNELPNLPGSQSKMQASIESSLGKVSNIG